MTVNNFFAHWMKEIDFKRHGDKIPMLSLINTVDIYKYFDAMLKFEKDRALKTCQHHLLYSKKKLNYKPAKLGEVIKQMTLMLAIDKLINLQINFKLNSIIPLRFLCSLGLVNQPVKFNTKWLLTYETDYQRLFESKANQANDALPDNVDAKSILTSTLYILYEQFKLDSKYKTYLGGIMISNNVLRTGIQLTPYQKSYEVVRGSQSKTGTFEASARQFSFLQFSLAYNSSKQHKSTCDSYNAEIAAVQIRSIKLENASDT